MDSDEQTASPRPRPRALAAVSGPNPKADELTSFFDDDAVWVDGPQGVRRGANAIVDELTKQLAISHSMTMEMITLVAKGGTVMVECRGGWTMGG